MIFPTELTKALKDLCLGTTPERIWAEGCDAGR